jgi:hypothetical protein
MKIVLILDKQLHGVCLLLSLRGCLFGDRFSYVVVALLVVEFVELFVVTKEQVVDNHLDDGSID